MATVGRMAMKENAWMNAGVREGSPQKEWKTEAKAANTPYNKAGFRWNGYKFMLQPVTLAFLTISAITRQTIVAKIGLSTTGAKTSDWCVARAESQTGQPIIVAELKNTTPAMSEISIQLNSFVCAKHPLALPSGVERVFMLGSESSNADSIPLDLFFWSPRRIGRFSSS